MKQLAWLRGVVLGLDDGLVTTSVTIMTVSSVVGPRLLNTMIGVVTASSISMALGGYAAARSVRDQNEYLAGLETGGAFLVGGLAPLLPVALHLPDAQWWSYACTALVALGFGWLKARYADSEKQGALGSALFFLAIVTAGTVAGVVIGLALQ
jgi:VIT1/CCC1 family predicted Fe2+/Mn2+ transporter